jgi:hypothetical protein
MSAGKGDKYRSVNKAKFDANYDVIFGKVSSELEVEKKRKLIKLEKQLWELRREYSRLPRKSSFSGMDILDKIEGLKSKIENEKSI